VKNVAVIIAASGAAGKTTTTQTFAIGQPQEFVDVRPCRLKAGWEDRRVHWTLYDNCAVSGNHHSGTDANNGPWMVREGMFEALKHRRIVIVDGYTSSPQWVEMCNEWDAAHYPEQELAVFILEIDLPADEVMKRLSQRRNKPLEEVQQTMAKKVAGNILRPRRLIGHFMRDCDLELVHAVVGKDHSPAQIAEVMYANIEAMLGVDPRKDFHALRKEARDGVRR
jgi:hypothetical protein